MATTTKANWELSPFPARSCWRKKFNGKQYYIGKGTTRYTAQEYKRALTEWDEIKAKLLAAEQAENVANLGAFSPDHPWVQSAAVAVAAMPTTELNEAHPWVDNYFDRKEAKKPATTTKKGVTVEQAVEKFLSHKTSQSITGRLKGGGRKANLASSLKSFVTAAGATQAVATIDANTLADFYAALCDDVAGDEISSTTAAEKLQSAKQFIRYAWSLGWCELPRNIDSRELIIFRSQHDVKPMPIAVLQKAIKSATGRLRLELLLMANCGMYQGDVAELLQTETDLARGVITRRRSKRMRGRDGKVPVVTYKLWPSTLELLRTHASIESELVLPNANGIASTRSSIDVDGRVSRTDNFRRRYDALKLSVKELPAAMTIRKTSATAIGNSEFSSFASYFLGHSPRGVAEKHYVKTDDAKFAQAIQWLGNHLGIDEVKRIEAVE